MRLRNVIHPCNPELWLFSSQSHLATKYSTPMIMKMVTPCFNRPSLLCDCLVGYIVFKELGVAIAWNNLPYNNACMGVHVVT